MTAAPPDFRYIDIHTHLHPPWRWAAIWRWFVGRPGWDFGYGTNPERAPQSPIFLGGSGASPADVTDEDLVRSQDRIVFGSDFPSTPHASEDERRPIWERPLPLSVHRKIFHDNAERLLGL